MLTRLIVLLPPERSAKRGREVDPVGGAEVGAPQMLEAACFRTAPRGRGALVNDHKGHRPWVHLHIHGHHTAMGRARQGEREKCLDTVVPVLRKVSDLYALHGGPNGHQDAL